MYANKTSPFSTIQKIFRFVYFSGQISFGAVGLKNSPSCRDKKVQSLPAVRPLATTKWTKNALNEVDKKREKVTCTARIFSGRDLPTTGVAYLGSAMGGQALVDFPRDFESFPCKYFHNRPTYSLDLGLQQ
uniref:Uncharacterized protein n=1 Tax=Romanomermis culicivorax TaxID=13658 RepID=A0A915L322_ROMCU